MKNKFPYVKPIIEVSIVEIEYALAAGSAQMVVDDNAMRIFEEWDAEQEVNKTIDW